MAEKRELNFDDFRASYVNSPGYTKAMSNYHAHDTYELYYLCNGERLYYINGRNHYVKRGEIVLIRHHVIHKTTASQVPDYERIVLQIPESFLIHSEPDDIDLTQCFNYSYPVVSLQKKEQGMIESILHNILDEAGSKTMGYKAIIQAQLTQALIYIQRHALCANHQLIQNTQVHKVINDVISYIGNNYMNEISVPLLAEHFHLSRSHLSRTFKKVTGLTLVEYITSVRVSQAQRLLRKTGAPISEISFDTGFNSITHFERTFKNVTDCSPTDFRKLHQGKYIAGADD